MSWHVVEQLVEGNGTYHMQVTGSSMLSVLPFFPAQVITFLKKNVILTGGFAGGFLLGMAS